jgi:hypothetical protein
MSGRLIITTKKTYCPWNPANVERVLRDERLERERLERQQNEDDDQSKRRRWQTNEHLQKGHINLFPEASEAEIRLAHGNDGGIPIAYNNDDAEKKQNITGILPVPLGGQESNNRKLGNVPFYMQAAQSHNQEGKYDNSTYLGIRGNGRGTTAPPSDGITDTLMRDQFVSREEYRKQKNDPMSRFYVDSSNAAAGNIYANRESSSRADDHAFQNNECHAASHERRNCSLQPDELERARSRKRKSSITEDADDARSEVSSSSSSSSSLSSSSTSSCDRRRRRKSRRRKHDNKKNKRSKHSSSSSSHHRRRHRSNNSPLHSKEKRRKDKKTKRKQHSKHRDEDEGDRRKRHNPTSPSSSSPSDIDLMERKKSDDSHQLDDMRRRRHAREAREMERQRKLMM